MPGKQTVMCWIGCALLGALTTTLPAQDKDTLPAIFEMIPGEAQMAVVITDLDRFNQDMAMLNREMELDIPGMSDVLDELRRTAGMNQGLNDKGGLIIAIMDMQGMDQSTNPPAMMLVPISDYADFVGNYAGNAQASSTQLNMPWGQGVYCKQSGDFAVLSSQKALVDGFRPGSGRMRMDMIAAGIGETYVASCDAAIVVDSRRGAASMRTLVESWIDWFQEPDDNAAAPTSEMQTRINRGIKGIVLEAVDSLLAQTEVLTVALDVTEDGLGVAMAAKFKPGSDMSKTFGGTAAGTAGAIERLPIGPYLTASTLDLTGVNVEALLNAVGESVQRYEIPWYGTKIEAMAPMLAQAKRVTTVTYAPSQLSFTSQLFSEVTLIDTADARAFSAAFQAYIDSLDGKSINLGRLPGPNGQIDPNASPVAVLLRTQYTNAAQVIDGVEVDQYVIEYNFPPQLMAALGQGAGWVMMIVGREQKGYVAAVGQTLVLTNNDDPTLLSRVMTAMAQNTGLGSAQPVRKVRPQLPETPMYQWYFSASDVARLFNQAVKLMDADIEQMTIDEQLAPIAMGVSADESGLSKRVFVPMEVLKAGKAPTRILWELMFPPEELLQSQQAMQPGQQNNGNPMMMGGPGGPGGPGGMGGMGGPGAFPGGAPVPGGRAR